MPWESNYENFEEIKLKPLKADFPRDFYSTNLKCCFDFVRLRGSINYGEVDKKAGEEEDIQSVCRQRTNTSCTQTGTFLSLYLMIVFMSFFHANIRALLSSSDKRKRSALIHLYTFAFKTQVALDLDV